MYTLLRLVLQWGPHRGPQGPMGPHGDPTGGMGAWSSLGGPEFSVLWPALWLLVLALIVIGAGYFLTHESTPENSDEAMDGLRTQYVQGHITTDEFETRRARLTAGRETDRHP